MGENLFVHGPALIAHWMPGTAMPDGMDEFIDLYARAMWLEERFFKNMEAATQNAIAKALGGAE